MPEYLLPEDLPSETTTIYIKGASGARQESAAAEEHVHLLVVLEGDEPGRIIQFDAHPISIGRMPPCDVVLQDVGVSRSHCSVGAQADAAVVTDLNSTNGTFVEGQRVLGSAILGNGGTLQVGEHVLRHEYRPKRKPQRSRELDPDLEKARKYVQALMPSPTRSGPVWAEWVFLPSAELGGDAFGYHALDERSSAMYLVDVSGHGTGAAMHAVSVINVLRHHALPRTDFHKPAQVLRSLNEMFQMERHGEMCFTIWYGVYDAVTRTLAYGSAGHHPGYLVPPERRETIPLVTRNLVLGAIPGYSFKAQSVVVPQGSSLYLFSDGVFEILTHDGRQWGLSDFVPLILSPQVSGVTEAQRLYDAVQQMAKRGPLDDDFSMMVMTFQ